MLIGEDIVVPDEKERNDCNGASAFLPVLLEGAFRTVKITSEYVRLVCIFIAHPSHLHFTKYIRKRKRTALNSGSAPSTFSLIYRVCSCNVSKALQLCRQTTAAEVHSIHQWLLHRVNSTASPLFHPNIPLRSSILSTNRRNARWPSTPSAAYPAPQLRPCALNGVHAMEGPFRRHRLSVTYCCRSFW